MFTYLTYLSDDMGTCDRAEIITFDFYYNFFTSSCFPGSIYSVLIFGCMFFIFLFLVSSFIVANLHTYKLLCAHTLHDVDTLNVSLWTCSNFWIDRCFNHLVCGTLRVFLCCLVISV